MIVPCRFLTYTVIWPKVGPGHFRVVLARSREWPRLAAVATCLFKSSVYFGEKQNPGVRAVFRRGLIHTSPKLPLNLDHLHCVSEEDYRQAYTKAIDFLHRYVHVVLRALGDRDCMPKCSSNPLSQVKYIWGENRNAGKIPLSRMERAESIWVLLLWNLMFQAWRIHLSQLACLKVFDSFDSGSNTLYANSLLLRSARHRKNSHH